MFEKPVPEIDVDKLMQEIREELPLRNGSPASPAASTMSMMDLAVDLDDVVVQLTRGPPKLNAPPPVQLSALIQGFACIPEQCPLKDHAAYHLADFDEYEDAEFVLAAYKAILKREADADGLHCYSEMLRKGATKAEILYRIERSPEARLIGTKISGLKLPYLISSLSRLPVFGKVFSVMFAIWKLPDIERNQRRQLSANAQRIRRNEEISARNLKTAIEALRRLEYSQNALSDMTRLLASKTHAEALQKALSQTSAAVQALQKQTSTHVDRKLFDQHVYALWAAAEKNADSELVEAGLRQLQVVAETKVDRSEFERWTGDVGASVQAIAAAKADAKEFAQAKMAIEDVVEKLHILRESKADASAFRDFDALFSRTIEAKAEREELGRLASQLSGLLDDRASKDDLQIVSESIESAHLAIANIRTDFADTDIRVTEMSSFLAEHNTALEDLQRSAKTALEDFIAQMDRKTDFPVDTKADRAAIDGMKIELTNMVDQATAALADRFDHVASTKADAAFVEAVKAETNSVIATTHKATVEELNSALAFVNSRALDLKKNVLDQDRRLGLLLEEARKRLPKPISVSQIATMLTEEDHRLDAMYASFEDQFRGTRDDIRRRQAIYLPYVQEAKGGSALAPIIDIGCGRGEWLELLRDEGLVAMGVDLNRIFLDGCRGLNLDVTEQDAIEFLRQRKRDSVGVVTSFHMIEHLEHRMLIALLDETFRVLRPGGIAIFETPNPRNVVVGSCNFYLDPTHKRPLPPELSRYLLEARGFSKVEVKELHPCNTEQMVSEGVKEVKDMLNRMFYSSQDYAVIGRKV
jgi:SAM-dependent methyltransferase